jgi:hypothetical protein
MLCRQIIVHLCVHAFPHVLRQPRVEEKCENLANESQTQSMSVHMAASTKSSIGMQIRWPMSEGITKYCFACLGESAAKSSDRGGIQRGIGQLQHFPSDFLNRKP